MTLTADDPRFDELKQYDDAFRNAKAEGGNYDLPPDGTYQAIVDRFDFFENRDGDRLFLKTELTVQNHPDESGRLIEIIHQLNDPDRVEWLKKHLHRLGVPVEEISVSQLRPGSEVLAAVCDVPVQVEVKTSDRKKDDGTPYRNAYVNQRLGPPLRQDVQRTGGSDVPNDFSQPGTVPTGPDEPPF